MIDYGCRLVTVDALRIRRVIADALRIRQVTGSGSPWCCWQWQGRSRPPHWFRTALVVVVPRVLLVWGTLVGFAGIGGKAVLTVISDWWWFHIFGQYARNPLFRCRSLLGGRLRSWLLPSLTLLKLL